MGEITLVKLDLEGATSTASFTINLPFSGRVRKTVGADEESGEFDVSGEDESEETRESAREEGDSGRGKGLAVVGVFVFFVVAVALAKYMMGGDDETDEPTPEENRAVGVTLEEDE